MLLYTLNWKASALKSLRSVGKESARPGELSSRPETGLPNSKPFAEGIMKDWTNVALMSSSSKRTELHALD